MVDIRCGNRARHGLGVEAYHESVAAVRDCFRLGPPDHAQPADPQLLAVPGPARTPVARPGYFSSKGDIYRVVHTKDKERLYAKRLNQSPDLDGEARWEYLPGAMSFLDEANRLTLAEAAEYGRRTGTCMICGRTLTNPASIAAGIGPICGGRLS